MESMLIGAFKLKDGLFLGDEFAAQDLEFVVANKVTRIINCAARQVPNHWEPIGVHYLSFAWFDTENQIILDSSDKHFNAIYSFIDSGLETGESVLVHSVRGVSRCVCVMTAYLMKKYSWSLYKTLDFISFRRPDLDLNPAFLAQLAALETRMLRTNKPRTEQWDQVLDAEELVLRNTVLNARMGEPTDYHLATNEGEAETVIKWEENGENLGTRARNRSENGVVYIKSCLRGGEKSEKRVAVCNLESLKEKSTYSRFNFAKGVRVGDEEIRKNRSASLNKNENKLVKEAISAARGMIDYENKGKNSLRVIGNSAERPNSKKVETLAKSFRPSTAPHKRAASPKASDKRPITVPNPKGSSNASLKKR
jgi:protein-tyrosine phosphatase